LLVAEGAWSGWHAGGCLVWVACWRVLGLDGMLEGAWSGWLGLHAGGCLVWVASCVLGLSGAWSGGHLE
jgi:hypothetical protein